MIEKHFKLGVRYLWKKPNDAPGRNDGVIVNSTGVATRMTYDTIHSVRGSVDPMLLTGKMHSKLGFAKPGDEVKYTWLDYVPGGTSRKQIGVNDILTGFMSGCLIIRGTYNGAMSAFHVGTIVGNTTVNKLVKSKLAQNLPQDATGFDPAAAWPGGEVASILAKVRSTFPKIVALITTTGTFHSILLCKVKEGGSKVVGAVGVKTSKDLGGKARFIDRAGRDYYCVGGIKQVQKLDRQTLLKKLTT